jgi:hypothetical protein
MFSEKTKRAIYCNAGGECQNPGCKKKMQFKGDCAEFAHIYGREETAPRFSSDKKVLFIRSEKNGLLLCSNCHTLVDKNEKKYPCEILQDWKNIKGSKILEPSESDESDEEPEKITKKKVPRKKEPPRTQSPKKIKGSVKKGTPKRSKSATVKKINVDNDNGVPKKDPVEKIKVPPTIKQQKITQKQLENKSIDLNDCKIIRVNIDGNDYDQTKEWKTKYDKIQNTILYIIYSKIDDGARIIKHSLYDFKIGTVTDEYTPLKFIGVSIKLELNDVKDLNKYYIECMRQCEVNAIKLTVLLQLANGEEVIINV